MTREQIIESITLLPVADQVAVAAEVLHRVGGRLEHARPVDDAEWEARRRRMAEAAEEAAEWYRTDPELTIWTVLDGEPFVECGENESASGAA